MDGSESGLDAIDTEQKAFPKKKMGNCQLFHLVYMILEFTVR